MAFYEQQALLLQCFINHFLQVSLFDQIIFINLFGTGMVKYHIHIIFDFSVFQPYVSENTIRNACYSIERNVLRGTQLLCLEKIVHIGSRYLCLLRIGYVRSLSVFAQQGNRGDGSLDLVHPTLQIFPIFSLGVFRQTDLFQGSPVGTAQHLPVEFIFQEKGIRQHFAKQPGLVRVFQNMKRFLIIISASPES